jgi:hypothetical protein
MNPIPAITCRLSRLFLLAGVALVALPAAAQTTNRPTVGRPDYSAFKVIADRNIFDPTRRGRSTYTPRDSSRQPRVEYVTLTGTMEYDEKGPIAFFEGSRSEYRKVLKPSDVIAGYEVKKVSLTSVTLASPTNELSLAVGMQLRRDDAGNWQVAEAPVSYDVPERSSSYRSGRSAVFSSLSAPVTTTNAEPDAAMADAEAQPVNPDSQTEIADPGAPPGAPPDAAAASGVTDPVLLRMMQRRAEQLNR